MLLESVLVLTAISLALAEPADSPLKPVGLRCEYLPDPLGIDVLRPRVGWELLGSGDQRQADYRVLVASTPELLKAGKGDLWDSGKVASGDQAQIEYAGAALRSRQACWWKVRVWDGDGKAGPWSRPARWEMGLLKPDDWQAKWIAGTDAWLDEPDHVTPAPYFRKQFDLPALPKKGRAYVCGLGYFELWLNNKRVGEDVLVPDQTDYDKRDLRNIDYPFRDCARHRALYLTYDVTRLLRKGRNAVGVVLGNGWYGPTVRDADGWTYGAPRVICRIEADGCAVVSDETWKTSTGPIRRDHVYTGEVYDARLEMPGWADAAFDDAAWKPAVPASAPDGRLCAQMSPPCRVTDTLRPVSITKHGPGDYVLDFGQNIVGWCRLRVRGPAGTEVKVEFGETLADGLPRPTPGAHATSQTYILKGKGVEVYEPHFAWFAGRYVRVTGWPGELTPDSIVARVVHTAVDTVGEFECSNELFNRIHRAFQWTQLDNMQGGRPSDCPQRERLGYTGDGHMTAETAMLNFDMAAFYSKWITDIGDAQDRETEVGYVPHTVPFEGGGGGPGCGAAIVILPWEMYAKYGDTRLLREQYQAMKLWVRYFGTWEKDGIVHMQRKDAWNLGDWLSPGELPPEELVHTFYYALSAELLSRIAGILGKPVDQAAYAAVAARVRAAFHAKFLDRVTMSYGSGGGSVFALALGGAPVGVAEALAKDIELRGRHLDTGFYGTALLFDVLNDIGRNDLAFAIMDQRTFPSYGYMLDHGATTLWESWDGKESHNHPAFGGGVKWIYRHLAGLQADPERPGFEHAIVRPQPVGDVTWCRYALRTIRGRFAVDWRREHGAFTLQVTIPPNATATVLLPDGSTHEAPSGQHAYRCTLR